VSKRTLHVQAPLSLSWSPKIAIDIPRSRAYDFTPHHGAKKIPQVKPEIKWPATPAAGPTGSAVPCRLCGSPRHVARFPRAEVSVALGLKLASEIKKDQIMIINLSGRGGKDMHTVAKAMGVKL